MPASAAAVASAANTAPHSGATTATPSGVQTPLRAGHDQNYEEELRYKQVMHSFTVRPGAPAREQAQRSLQAVTVTF